MATGAISIARSLGIAALLIFPGIHGWAQQVNRLSVDLNDPDIRDFLAQQSADRRVRTLTAMRGRQGITALQLPVLNLTEPPSPPSRNKTRASGRAAPCRQDLSTGSDPGWYTILHTCPGMTISITADLRVQTNLDTAIPEAYNQSTVITPASGNRREEGGLTASITTYRFPNIPYHITVECTERTKKTCTDEQELRALLSNIKLVSVPSTGGRGR